MKKIIRMLMCGLLILLLMSGSVWADIKRGDRGEDVQELQQMLFECGWLFELPDGIFGKNTEQAVKDFEKYVHLPVDGIADERMIYELSVALDVLREELYGNSNQTKVGFEYPECCMEWTDETGAIRTESCELHQQMQESVQPLLQSNEIENIKKATQSWQWEVEELYIRWIEQLPEAERGAAIAHQAMFFAGIDSQRILGSVGVQSEDKTKKTEFGIIKTLRNQASWLCGMIWELEHSTTESNKTIRLSESTIIDGETIYYSGSVDGVHQGIYTMDLDGGNVHQLVDFVPGLQAVSNGNLLVHWFDWDENENTVMVIRKDGTHIRLNEGHNGYAVADNGRFYWGVYSVAEDGSDYKQIIPCQQGNENSYYPLAVEEGYLYYANDAEFNGVVFYEPNILPPGAKLCRIHLESGAVETLSGVGTQYIGLEDGMIYYLRQNFYQYGEYDFVEVKVDEGLYCMNLETLTETQLAELTNEEHLFEYYMFLKNGIVYGEAVDYYASEAEGGTYFVLRIGANGVKLPLIPIETETGAVILDVVDGVHYCSHTYYPNEDWNYEEGIDCIIMTDLRNGLSKEIMLEGGRTMFYGEYNPHIAVVNGRIYFESQEHETYRTELRSITLDGMNEVLLAKGIQY